MNMKKIRKMKKMKILMFKIQKKVEVLARVPRPIISARSEFLIFSAHKEGAKAHVLFPSGQVRALCAES